MILPERVFGNSATMKIWRGLAIAPIADATWERSSVDASSAVWASVWLAFRITKATTA